jgi:hypothetical protein
MSIPVILFPVSILNGWTYQAEESADLLAALSHLVDDLGARQAGVMQLLDRALDLVARDAADTLLDGLVVLESVWHPISPPEHSSSSCRGVQSREPAPMENVVKDPCPPQMRIVPTQSVHFPAARAYLHSPVVDLALDGPVLVDQVGMLLPMFRRIDCHRSSPWVGRHFGLAVYNTVPTV